MMKDQGRIPQSEGTNNSSFEYARLNDATVAKMLRDRRTLETIIGKLSAEKEVYFKRIIELESIAPRRITLPDGRIMVWRCPDEFIPETQ